MARTLRFCHRNLPCRCRVRFDAAAVSQAVVNLIDNAAKYSGARDRSRCDSPPQTALDV